MLSSKGIFLTLRKTGLFYAKIVVLVACKSVHFLILRKTGLFYAKIVVACKSKTQSKKWPRG